MYRVGIGKKKEKEDSGKRSVSGKKTKGRLDKKIPATKPKG